MRDRDYEAAKRSVDAAILALEREQYGMAASIFDKELEPTDGWKFAIDQFGMVLPLAAVTVAGIASFALAGIKALPVVMLCAFFWWLLNDNDRYREKFDRLRTFRDEYKRAPQLFREKDMLKERLK